MKRKTKTKAKKATSQTEIAPTRDELLINQVAKEAAKASEFEVTIWVGAVMITMKAAA